METAPKAEVIEKKPRQALKDTLEELESVIKYDLVELNNFKEKVYNNIEQVRS